MSKTEEQKELKDLKAGDEVAIQYRLSESYTLHKIKEVTARGTIILDNGEKYRADGSAMRKGDKWNRPAPIQVVTQEIRDVMRQRALASFCNGLSINVWRTIDLNTLESIYALLKSAQGANQR